MSRNQLLCIVFAGCTLAFGAATTPGAAADLPVKAPPADSVSPLSDVHGWVDVTFLNSFISPRGLVLTDRGLSTQVDMGLAIDLYKNKNGPINGFTVYGGKWEDYWSQLNNPLNASWYESDWYAGAKTRFLQNWTFDLGVGQFRSPIAAYKQDTWVKPALSYNDSGMWGDGGFVGFNPYINLFYQISGASTTVLGNAGNTYDVEIGMVPTFDLKKAGLGPLPITLKVPTWITVGPASFWNGNAGAFIPSAVPGPLPASNNLGVFSTGLSAIMPLQAIPARYGNWYVKGGVQWYHLINDGLVLAQQITTTHTNRDPVVVSTGFGFTF
jgi:hypothetical protein